MNNLRLLIIVLAVLGTGVFAQSAREANAAFHLMRIHAVMGGLNGDGNVQYVELRMCSGGQQFVSGHTIDFRDASGTLKATFTFPANETNGGNGESILIATSEYDAASVGPGGGGTGGDADVVFSVANTSGFNGGDPLHPVQAPGGRVEFGDQEGEGCDAGFGLNAGDIDSVAYGTAPTEGFPEGTCGADTTDNDGDGFVNDGCAVVTAAETACADAIDSDGDSSVNDGCPITGLSAAALPSPSNNCALRLDSPLSGATQAPADNAIDYAVSATASAPKMVTLANLTTDLDTPRNNSREVAQLSANADSDCDGVANATDNCPSTANPGQENNVHPGTTTGDHCDDPDSDTVFDISDNCPDDANSNQANFDGDSMGDVCDPNDDNDANPDATDADDDNDRVNDTDEANCGGTTPSNLRPERVDGIFDNVDDDGDTMMDEALPGGSSNFDCDGDGYKGTVEDHVYFDLAQTDGDQKTCQEYDLSFPNPTHKPSRRWPADLANGGSSLNRINVADLGAFVVPVRYLGQAVGTDLGDRRFDMANPVGTLSIADMATLTSGATGSPPMLAGVRAFGAPGCPYAP